MSFPSSLVRRLLHSRRSLHSRFRGVFRQPSALPLLPLWARSLATTTNVAPPRSVRRKRPGFITIPEPVVQSQVLGLSEAYRPNEDNVDDYLNKTSLSPWVPLPDAACRAIIDLVHMNHTDKHVDLGSGDGRVNFWMADDANVTWTLGVDVDEGILEKAQERLSKRHPKPDNIEFLQVDLLKDQRNPVWDRIRQATVITMFFATPALRIFRPVLEEQLRGHSCKIVTAGYPMPGWNAWQTTVVLGTTLHYYRWGQAWEENADEGESFLTDDFIMPEENSNLDESEIFKGANIIDRTSGTEWYKEQMVKSDMSSGDDVFEDEEEEEEKGGEDAKEEKGKHSGKSKPVSVAVETTKRSS